MQGGAGGLLVFVDAGEVGGKGVGVQEALPDDFHGGRGRVDEVFGVESVVPELIHQDFKSRKIIDPGGLSGRLRRRQKDILYG